MKQLLEQIGLEPERIGMFNLSAAMAYDFAAIVEEMAARISQIGPNPLGRGAPSASAPDGRDPGDPLPLFPAGSQATGPGANDV